MVVGWFVLDWLLVLFCGCFDNFIQYYDSLFDMFFELFRFFVSIVFIIIVVGLLLLLVIGF